MYVYSSTYEPAAAVAATLTEKRRSDYALGWTGEPADTGRIVVGYVVKRYPGMGGFGIVERWRYADRPELGTFGGAFIASDTIARLLRD